MATFINEGMQRLELRSISNQVLTLAAIAKSFAPDTEWGWLFNAARALYGQSDPHHLKPPIPVNGIRSVPLELQPLEPA